MTTALRAFVADEMMRPASTIALAVAQHLAVNPDTAAILFYGSNLRTRASDGVLDFYVLTHGARERGLWPTVGYREFVIDKAIVRAKIATMRLATFAAAAAGRTLDTTIWARFVQPTALVWSRDDESRRAVIAAVTAAAITAGRFASALGPRTGTPRDYWRALFHRTYAAELRVEKSGREDQIIGHHPARYEALLPLAWAAAGITFVARDGVLRPDLDPLQQRHLDHAWAARRLAGKPLNVARLIRAAFTFDGAARYGAWKIERHTGVAVPLTPWRERHPIMAAPGVLWRVWRKRVPAS